MRSVIRKPLTMLVTEANTAIAPSAVLSVVFCSPAMMIEPTTAIAEIALVSDISGVCSSRDTFWITWKPTKVASIRREQHREEVELAHGVSSGRKTATGASTWGVLFQAVLVLAARHDHGGREVAGDVHRGAAHVEEAVDAEHHADALGGHADHAEDHRDHRDRAGRHARGADAAEDADERRP